MNDDLYLMANEHTKAEEGPPPATDTFYPNSTLVRRLTLSPLALGLGLAFAWGVLFVIISLVAAASGGAALLDVFRTLYPGFTLGSFTGIFAGFIWSFLYGLISGLLVALFYNSLVRQGVAGGGESTETYA